VKALYTRDREFFVPSEAAGSPWSARGQHGGPPCGLLARAVEEWNADSELVPVRLTVDLFRQVPMSPLAIRLEPARQGRRLVLLRLALFGDDREICRATALLLRRSEMADVELTATGADRPPGPDGLATSSLVPVERRGETPPGFHTHVEVRWAYDRGGLPAAWIRMPMPLVEGEETTPLQRVATLSDFGNALASADRPPSGGTGFINTDMSLYLSRFPRGEWIGLQVRRISEHQGVGLVEVAEYDLDGRFAHLCQARLAQSFYRIGGGDP